MDMITTYKIIHKLVDICFSDLFHIVIQQLNLIIINYSNSLVILILDFRASHKEWLMIGIHYLLILLMYQM